MLFSRAMRHQWLPTPAILPTDSNLYVRYKFMHVCNVSNPTQSNLFKSGNKAHTDTHCTIYTVEIKPNNITYRT